MTRKPRKAAGATPKRSARKGATPRRAKSADQETGRDLTALGKPNDKYTPAQVIAALENSAGIRMGAAQMLKCSPSTISNYVDKYPEVKAALDEILENRLDIAESIILKRMSDDKHKTLQFNAACFYLKTKGKQRGYVEGKELTGKDGGAVQVEHTGDVLDVSGFSDEELDQFEEMLSRTVTLEADEYAEA